MLVGFHVRIRHIIQLPVFVICVISAKVKRTTHGFRNISRLIGSDKMSMLFVFLFVMLHLLVTIRYVRLQDHFSSARWVRHVEDLVKLEGRCVVV